MKVKELQTILAKMEPNVEFNNCRTFFDIAKESDALQESKKVDDNEDGPMEQIEEMAKERSEIKDIMKLLDKCVSLNPMCKSEVASVLYGNNYRKISEDSVVLSMEEYKKLKGSYKGEKYYNEKKLLSGKFHTVNMNLQRTVELFSIVPQQAYSALANWLKSSSKTKKIKSVFTELLK